MAENWSSQDDEPDDIGAWMAWRKAQSALQPEADAVARNLWNRGTWGGVNLQAPNPSDLTAIGLAALRGAGAPTAANSEETDSASYPPPSEDDAGLHQDNNGVKESAEGSEPYLASDGSTILNRASVSSGSQSSGSGLSPPTFPDFPTVSEVEVVGRPSLPEPYSGFLDDLNHSLAVRRAAGVLGYIGGLPSGVVRGGIHAVQGIGDSLGFARSLLSPEGRIKAWDEMTTATHDALEYGRSVAANPSRLASDAISEGTSAIHSLVPFTTPMADNAWGEMKHEFGVGMNAGETAANIAGFVAAPEVFEGLNAARTFGATREANIAEIMAQGLDEPTARYLSKAYDGQGDHAIVQKSQKSIFGYKTPWLKSWPIPKTIIDSRFNVSIPRGMSQYDFYKYHYAVDPQFYGGALPRHLNDGKGFSGRRLGFERYSGAERLWARTPQIWKDYYTGVTLGDLLGQLPPDTSEAPR